MRRICTVLLFALAVARVGNCFAQAAKPCFAFLLKGDVVLSCGGEVTPLTHRRNVESLAVDSGREVFTFTTARPAKGSAASGLGTSVVELSRGTVRLLAPVGGIVNTCGGLFPVAAPGSSGSAVRDVVTGEELRFDAYKWFRCSADRTTVVGSAKACGGDLYEGVPPAIKIAPADASHSWFQFNTSPDGSKVAYYRGPSPLCLFSSPGPPECVEAGTVGDLPAVNDDGEVLVAVGTGQECIYDTFYDFSPVRSPGAAGEGRDECLGIGYWKPGLKSVEIIQPLGRSPQWVTPATAKLLRRWAAQATENTPR